MSTRTIIEINHDELAFVSDHASLIFPKLLKGLRSGDAVAELVDDKEFAQGIRILGQRHHTEPEWVQAEIEAEITGIDRSPAANRMRAMASVMAVPCDEDIERAVAYAQAISLSAEYTWPDYMRDLWRVMDGGMPADKTIGGWFAPSQQSGLTAKLRAHAAAHVDCATGQDELIAIADKIDATVGGLRDLVHRIREAAGDPRGMMPNNVLVDYIAKLAKGPQELHAAASAAIRAHDQLQVAEAGGWQDIETMPTAEDVSFLILIESDLNEAVAVEVQRFEGQLYPTAWGGAIDWSDRVDVSKATHWRPALALPAEVAKGTVERPGIAHNDHPARHWDRNCPGCNPTVSQGANCG